MDTLRGPFDTGEPADRGWDAPEDDSPETLVPHDLPPEAIGQDERRMQVRAYNHWASQLGDRMFPLIDDLDPANLPDFGPYSVLLDFTAGIENPAVQFLGERLRQECGGHGTIKHLSDVPPRSLLSRITDHYMQILSNQAPIGFEAEFVNQRGVEILYRGILLPYSSNDETIDFIYGVINWKELADQLTADELLLEIDQALELGSELEVTGEALRRAADPVTDWADSPAHEAEDAFADSGQFDADVRGQDIRPLADFSAYALDADDEEYDEDEGEDSTAGYSFASLADYIEAPAKKAIDPSSLPYDPAADADFAAPYADSQAPDFGAPDSGGQATGLADMVYAAAVLPEDAGLYDWLAAARELAQAADASEDRSRSALYAAVSRAYDFSLAAAAAPEDYAELIAESGLTVQERAPMTPVVKLVFGHDYDKTRLTEYAAVLTHAHRLGLERGTLARFLSEAEGGIKGVVKAERRLRRAEQGAAIDAEKGIRKALAEKLRALEALTLAALASDGPEFALVMVRRDAHGNLAVLGELPEDVPQLERAAKKLVG
ncbi:PAS domain-containing protein [Erythrobacter tepidarius]|uniref:PAS domain-containing protein n=1 Tax=Erythrobacter tepidarius TaxID=60454 RepID=UPI000A3C1B8C|nr:hypothetical protein [Erythrobacter tepidarius]